MAGSEWRRSAGLVGLAEDRTKNSISDEKMRRMMEMEMEMEVEMR